MLSLATHEAHERESNIGNNYIASEYCNYTHEAKNYDWKRHSLLQRNKSNENSGQFMAQNVLQMLELATTVVNQAIYEQPKTSYLGAENVRLMKDP